MSNYQNVVKSLTKTSSQEYHAAIKNDDANPYLLTWKDAQSVLLRGKKQATKQYMPHRSF